MFERPAFKLRNKKIVVTIFNFLKLNQASQKSLRLRFCINAKPEVSIVKKWTKTTLYQFDHPLFQISPFRI